MSNIQEDEIFCVNGMDGFVEDAVKNGMSRRHAEISMDIFQKLDSDFDEAIFNMAALFEDQIPPVMFAQIILNVICNKLGQKVANFKECLPADQYKVFDRQMDILIKETIKSHSKK